MCSFSDLGRVDLNRLGVIGFRDQGLGLNLEFADFGLKPFRSCRALVWDLSFAALRDDDSDQVSRPPFYSGFEFNFSVYYKASS